MKKILFLFIAIAFFALFAMFTNAGAIGPPEETMIATQTAPSSSGAIDQITLTAYATIENGIAATEVMIMTQGGLKNANTRMKPNEVGSLKFPIKTTTAMTFNSLSQTAGFHARI
jgi:hypothetical protein